MRFYCSDLYNRETKENPCFFTDWSFLHFISGFGISVPVLFLLYFFYSKCNKLVPLNRIKVYTFLIFTLIHLAYELKDVYHNYFYDDYQGECNTWQNSVGDQLVSMIGAAIFLFLVTIPPSWWVWLVLVFYYILSRVFNKYMGTS